MFTNTQKAVAAETLKLIETKARERAAALASEKRAELDSFANQILYEQMKKLQAFSDFAKDFHQIYDQQEKEISRLRDECLVERVAVTSLKQGEGKKCHESVLFKCPDFKQI